MQHLLSVARRLPIDLGQRTERFVTQGKLIAQESIPWARAGARALDVGCREGRQTAWLEQRGYEVTAIDIEPVHPRVLRVDANGALPFGNSTFDVVWCSEVIEHLRDPKFSVSEFRRVLVPGGVLIVTTPNSYAWFFRVLYAFGFAPRSLQHPGHLHFFDLADVRELFPTSEIRGFFPYALIKATIVSPLAVALLTPTFVVREAKA